jgi:hypothetical protein
VEKIRFKAVYHFVNVRSSMKTNDLCAGRFVRGPKCIERTFWTTVALEANNPVIWKRGKKSTRMGACRRVALL